MTADSQPPVPSPSPGASSFGVPARRERIVAMLTEAYARNDLDERELERRLERAEAAETIGELEALVADFPPEARATYGAPRSPAARAALTPAQIEEQVNRLDGESAPTRFSLIGDLRLEVKSADARVARVVCIVGDTHVDLRPLAGESGVFLLKVATLVGDTRIRVPAGTQVDVRAISIIGEQKRRDAREGGVLARLGRKLGVLPEAPRAPPGPPGPVVVVTGYKLIGDIKILEY